MANICFAIVNYPSELLYLLIIENQKIGVIMRRSTSLLFNAAIAMLFAFFSMQSNATTVITVQDGKWESSETWGDGKLPKAGDNVIIANKVTVDKSADARFGHACVLAKGSLTVRDGASVKIIELKNFGEINNFGTIEIGQCDGTDAKDDVQVFCETVAPGEWTDPNVWNDHKLPSKDDIVVISHDVRASQAIAEIPLMLIVRNGATFSVGKCGSIAAKGILNYGKIVNEGDIKVDEH